MKRNHRSAELKSRVAIEALKSLKTVNELAAEYEVHPNQISKWKKQLQAGATDIFSSSHARDHQNDEALKARLYEEIGRLKVELDFVKKKAAGLS